MNRQLVSFLSLFSLVLILSIYYITLPFKNVNKDNSPVNLEIQDSSEVYFASLTSRKTAAYEESLAAKNSILASASATAAEKAVALEEIEKINLIMEHEDTAVSNIVEAGYAAAYVENYGDTVTVVVYKEAGTKLDAAKIMNIVFAEFGNTISPEIKFYS